MDFRLPAPYYLLHLSRGPNRSPRGPVRGPAEPEAPAEPQEPAEPEEPEEPQEPAEPAEPEEPSQVPNIRRVVITALGAAADTRCCEGS